MLKQLLISICALALLIAGLPTNIWSQNQPTSEYSTHPKPENTEEIKEIKILVPTLHSTNVVITTRISLSLLWPDAFRLKWDHNWDHITSNFSSAPEFDPGADFFEWDQDPWQINLIGHMAMGSEFYLQYRKGGVEPLSALLITMTWSTGWEFLVEGWHNEVSGVDLFWTPFAGALLGEVRFQLLRSVKSLSPSVGRHLLLYLLDPIGQLSSDIFGIEYWVYR